MDVYSAYAIASSRRDDLAREADESRLARRSRDTQDESAPAPRPAPRVVRARRLGIAR